MTKCNYREPSTIPCTEEAVFEGMVMVMGQIVQINLCEQHVKNIARPIVENGNMIDKPVEEEGDGA